MLHHDTVGTLDFYRSRYAIETPLTRRMLHAIADSGWEYRPHPNSPSTLDIVSTIVRCLGVCVELLETGNAKLDIALPNHGKQLLALFDQHTSSLATALPLSEQHRWDTEAAVTLGRDELLRQPLGNLLWLFLFDGIHHRGQISTYLRPCGAHVPSTYGHSLDDAQ